MKSAGYSGKPLPQKLGIKPGDSVLLLGAPIEVASLLKQSEPAAKFSTRFTIGKRHEMVLLFAKNFQSLEPNWKLFPQMIPQDGAVWVAWPKKKSGVKTDLGETIVRESGIAAGFVDVKVCAIDETWSGHKFVIPVKNRK